MYHTGHFNHAGTHEKLVENLIAVFYAALVMCTCSAELATSRGQI